MEHHALRCPNCGRDLTEDELYCYFCELDLAKLEKSHEKSRKKHSSQEHR